MLTVRPTEAHPESTECDEDVCLRLAATAERVALVRGLAADLAAREEFDMDRIEDLRLAVEEACAVLIEASVPGASLDCRFRISPDRIGLRLRSATADPTGPDRDTFGWHVLETLSDSVRLVVDPPTAECASSTLELAIGIRRRPLTDVSSDPTAKEPTDQAEAVAAPIPSDAVDGELRTISQHIENNPLVSSRPAIPTQVAGSEQ